MEAREAAEAVWTRSDEELLVDLRTGDNDALGVLVTRWEQPLFRFVYRILDRREDARDVCQETFVRVLRNAARFRDGSRFSTWMYQIALNLCRDHQRRKRRWGLLMAEPSQRGDGLEIEAMPDAASAWEPSATLEREEARRAVQHALLRLPPDQREVLVLKEYEGLKFREIAEVLGCPESTVKSRMYQALSTMKTSLARQGIR